MPGSRSAQASRQECRGLQPSRSAIGRQLNTEEDWEPSRQRVRGQPPRRHLATRVHEPRHTDVTRGLHHVVGAEHVVLERLMASETSRRRIRRQVTHTLRPELRQDVVHLARVREIQLHERARQVRRPAPAPSAACFAERSESRTMDDATGPDVPASWAPRPECHGTERRSTSAPQGPSRHAWSREPRVASPSRSPTLKRSSSPIENVYGPGGPSTCATSTRHGPSLGPIASTTR